MRFTSPFARYRLSPAPPTIEITTYRHSQLPEPLPNVPLDGPLKPLPDALSPPRRPQTTESENRTMCNDPSEQVENSLSPKAPKSLLGLEEGERQEPVGQDLVEVGVGARTHQSSTRLLDMIVFPLTFLIYLSGYLNRSTVGNAALYGFEFFALDSQRLYYSLVLSSFSVAYLFFSIATNGSWTRTLSPVKLISLAVFITSLASITIGVSSSFGLIIVSRGVMGMSEALFARNTERYYTYMYTRNEMSRRMSLFIGSAVLAGALGGAIAYGISFIETRIKTWRLLFILEGAPGILLSILCLLFFPAPDVSKFSDQNLNSGLSPNESTSEFDSFFDNSTGIDRKIALSTLRDPNAWIFSLAYGCINLSVGSLAGYLPALIASFGYSHRDSQLYTVSPYLTAFIILFVVAAASDRLQIRGCFVVIMCLIGSAGWAILLWSDERALKYIGTFLAVVGAYCPIPLMLSWLSNNYTSYSQKIVSLSMMHSFSQCFTIISSFIFFTTSDPQDNRLGYLLNLGSNGVAIVAVGYLTVFYGYKNAKDERRYEPDGESFRYVV